MLVRALGAGALTRMMAVEDDRGSDLSWLLFGPIDAEIIEPPDAPAFPLAAE